MTSRIYTNRSGHGPSTDTSPDRGSISRNDDRMPAKARSEVIFEIIACLHACERARDGNSPEKVVAVPGVI